MAKEKKEKDFEKKEAFTAEDFMDKKTFHLVEAFKNKATKVFESGKAKACSDIISTFKPLVYSDDARMMNYEKCIKGLNKTIRGAGTVAGIAYGIVNAKNLGSGESESEFLNFLVALPGMKQAIMGVAGNWVAGYLHVKGFQAMHNAEHRTMTDFIMGEYSNEPTAYRGELYNIVKKSEEYLKKNHPDKYQKVMRNTDAKIEDIKEIITFDKKDRELRKEEERVERSCVYDGDEKNDLKKAREELEKTRPEKKPNAIKKIFTKIKSDIHSRD